MTWHLRTLLDSGVWVSHAATTTCRAQTHKSSQSVSPICPTMYPSPTPTFPARKALVCIYIELVIIDVTTEDAHILLPVSLRSSLRPLVQVTSRLHAPLLLALHL